MLTEVIFKGKGVVPRYLRTTMELNQLKGT